MSKRGASAVFALWCGIGCMAMGQGGTVAVGVGQLTGTWFEVARLPDKRERRCVSDGVVVVSLGEKARRFQVVTSCRTQAGYADWQNANGRLKDGAGTIALTFTWPFAHTYRVLAMAPDESWTVVGGPNHKELWLLSKSATPAAEVVAQMKQVAAAGGYGLDKLVTVTQTGR